MVVPLICGLARAVLREHHAGSADRPDLAALADPGLQASLRTRATPTGD